MSASRSELKNCRPHWNGLGFTLLLSDWFAGPNLDSWRANSLPDEARQAAVKAGDSEVKHRVVRDQEINFLFAVVFLRLMLLRSRFRLVRLPPYTGLPNPEYEQVSTSGWRATGTFHNERIYSLFNSNMLDNIHSTLINSVWSRNRKAYRQAE